LTANRESLPRALPKSVWRGSLLSVGSPDGKFERHRLSRP